MNALLLSSVAGGSPTALGAITWPAVVLPMARPFLWLTSPGEM